MTAEVFSRCSHGKDLMTHFLRAILSFVRGMLPERPIGLHCLGELQKAAPCLCKLREASGVRDSNGLFAVGTEHLSVRKDVVDEDVRVCGRRRLDRENLHWRTW